MFHESQFGFRAKYSTEDALENVLNQIYTGLDNDNSVSGVFLDVQKAFDTVHHGKLLEKLELYGVSGVAYSWLLDYLSNRRQIAKINDIYSSSTPVNCGVPQGSVLGPLLFLIYVNDIFQLNLSSKLTLFADDTASINICRNSNQAIHDVGSDLQTILQWFNQNLLTLNIDKCNYVNFALRESNAYNRQLIVHNPRCESTTPCNCASINSVNNVKYLGVCLDSKLNWKLHINHIVNRFRALLCKMYYLRKFVSLSTLKSFYFAMGQSILQYSISCWGGTYMNAIAPLIVLQNKLLKVMTFKTQRSPSLPLYQELEILPVRRLYIYRTIVDFRKKGAHITNRQLSNYHTRGEAK